MSGVVLKMPCRGADGDCLHLVALADLPGRYQCRFRPCAPYSWPLVQVMQNFDPEFPATIIDGPFSPDARLRACAAREVGA